MTKTAAGGNRGSCWECSCPISKRTLAEYHSGLKPNRYYEAQVRRDQLRVRLRTKEEQRLTTERTIEQLRGLAKDVLVNFDFDDFVDDSRQFVVESDKLQNAQIGYKRRVADLAKKGFFGLNKAIYGRTALTGDEQVA